MKIGMIGLGNMADAIIGGMLQKKVVKKEELIGSAATERTVARMREKYGFHTTRDNREVAREADILILAVKPQFLEEVIVQIRDCIREETLLITIAAGKNIRWYEETFKRPIRLVRCMPNTPALVGEGCTAVCPGEKVSEEENHKKMKEGVMEEVKHIFKPEFINRVDEMIVFHALNQENIRSITDILVDNFIKRVREQMHMELHIKDEVVDFVSKKGFDKDYGARPIRRAIQTEIEDVLAEAVLAGEMAIGNEAEVALVRDGDRKKVFVQKITKK